MKLSKLLKILQEKEKLLKGDPDVIVDSDDNGWWDLERVEIVDTGTDLRINLKSSNEA